MQSYKIVGNPDSTLNSRKNSEMTHFDFNLGRWAAKAHFASIIRSADGLFLLTKPTVGVLYSENKLYCMRNGVAYGSI